MSHGAQLSRLHPRSFQDLSPKTSVSGGTINLESFLLVQSRFLLLVQTENKLLTTL